MAGERTAAVVGAGIGGLAAGISLTAAGFSVMHYEKSPEPRELGAGLGIWPNGVRALRALGLDELVAQGLEQAGGVRRADGRMLAGFEAGAIERRFGEPILGLHRAQLHAALLAACGPERVRLDMPVQAVEVGGDGEGAELRFADGSRASADLVVGADGLRSAVRASLLGDGEPRDAGIVAYRGVAELTTEVPAGEWWGIGSVAGVLPLRGGLVYWYFGARGEDEPGAIERLASEYDPVVGEVVALTPPAEVLVHQLYDRDPVRSWSRGPATLLGDAAHPMLPFIGQGAGAALEDAVELGRALEAEPQIPAALARYEARRAERMALFVKTSRRAAGLALPRSALTRRLRDALFPLIPESTRLRQFAPGPRLVSAG
jgi:2-polyprenyl-6-methoxyphenol hydroxylase-like FAD-dependent oxidoreductase